jgi:hypothetical protein
VLFIARGSRISMILPFTHVLPVTEAPILLIFRIENLISSLQLSLDSTIAHWSILRVFSRVGNSWIGSVFPSITIAVGVEVRYPLKGYCFRDSNMAEKARDSDCLVFHL